MIDFEDNIIVRARNERIAELMRNELFIADLKAEIERLQRGRDRLIETQEGLIEENKRLESSVLFWQDRAEKIADDKMTLVAENERLTSACCANPTSLDAARWDAFRKSKVTDIIFEDMAHHSFHGPPMPEAIDDLGDFLIKRSKQ